MLQMEGEVHLKHTRIAVPALAVCLMATAGQPVLGAQIGDVAELSDLFHNVGGTVTVVDADTFRVDDFTYDGGGPVVYFYLGSEQTDAAFTSGLEVQPLLTGTVYDGTQGPVFFDLPAGETFDGYHAISVWCAQFGVDFGSGTFMTPPIPGDVTGDGFVGLADLDLILNNWNLAVPPGDPAAELTGDNFVGLDDLDIVLNNWNAGTPPATASVVPEPVGAMLLGSPLLLLKRKRYSTA